MQQRVPMKTWLNILNLNGLQTLIHDRPFSDKYHDMCRPSLTLSFTMSSLCKKSISS